MAPEIVAIVAEVRRCWTPDRNWFVGPQRSKCPLGLSVANALAQLDLSLVIVTVGEVHPMMIFSELTSGFEEKSFDR